MSGTGGIGAAWKIGTTGSLGSCDVTSPGNGVGLAPGVLGGTVGEVCGAPGGVVGAVCWVAGGACGFCVAGCVPGGSAGFCSCPGGFVASFGVVGVGDAVGVCDRATLDAESIKLAMTTALTTERDVKIDIRRKTP